jgi:hypothetical protein
MPREPRTPLLIPSLEAAVTNSKNHAAQERKEKKPNVEANGKEVSKGRTKQMTKKISCIVIQSYS